MYKLLSSLVLSVILLAFGTGSELPGAADRASKQLTSLQELKQSIAAQLNKQATEIKLNYYGNKAELSKSIGDLMKKAVMENDYIAYIIDSYFYTVRTRGSSATVKVTVNYRETAEETSLVEQKIDNLLRDVVSPAMTETEKVKAIHDWVVRHLAYDTSLTRYTAYEALTEGQAVCQGYALLIHRMLDKSGIENRIVEGEVDTGAHVWNLVKLDHKWYHIDATWDDPTPDKPDKVSYNYFLKSDEQMRKDHTWTKAYPAAVEPGKRQ